MTYIKSPKNLKFFAFISVKNAKDMQCYRFVFYYLSLCNYFHTFYIKAPKTHGSTNKQQQNRVSHSPDWPHSCDPLLQEF